MKIERTREFPVAPETLAEMLRSREYYETRHAWSGITDYRFDAFGEVEEGFLVRIERPLEISKRKLPGFVSALVPSSSTLIMELCWKRWREPPYQGRYRFALERVPAEVQGSMEITGGGQGARQDIELRIHSSVPLLGGRIAGMAASGVDRVLESDYRATLRYIEECLGASSAQGRQGP